jgi:CelD/BcsL family acetyltransferase involved in cellulose biosynthesis
MQTFVQTIASPGELDALRKDWDALAKKCPGSSQAQGPVYGGLAIERALRQGAKVKLIAARNASGLVGLWPLALWREGIFRVLRPVSCGSDDEYSLPLAAPEVEEEVLQAILAAAMTIPCDKIWFVNVKTGSALACLLERPAYAALQKRRFTHVIYEVDLARFATWEDYLAERSKRHQKNRARLKRRLAEQGKVELNWCRTPEDAEVVLNWVFDAKARWARQRRIDAPWLENRRVRDFWIELSKRVDLADLPLVAYLKLDGRPIAGLLNLVGEISLEFYITAYDETFWQYSPGEQLIEFLLQWCLENRKNADFRRAATDYKERVADRQTLFSSYAFDLSPKARLLSRPLFRLENTLRRAPRKAQAMVEKMGWSAPARGGRGGDKV